MHVIIAIKYIKFKTSKPPPEIVRIFVLDEVFFITRILKTSFLRHLIYS